jgi:type III secretory pathway component EscT
VSRYDTFTGLPVVVDDAQSRRWGSLLVKAVFVVLVLGVVLAVVLWALTSADVGALTLAAVFAVCAGLLVLRQALLAERR